MDNIEQLKEYRKKLSMLSEEEKKLRDLYLKKISEGSLQGPVLNQIDIDRTFLKFVSESAIMSDIPKATAYESLIENNKNHLDDIALIYHVEKLEELKTKIIRKVPFLSKFINKINFDKKITYREMISKIDSTAKALKQIGVSKGDVVTICSPALPQNIYSFFAIDKIGAISDMIHPLSSEDEIKYYLNETGSKYLLFFDKFKEKLKNVIPKTKLEKIVLLNPLDSFNPIFSKILNNCCELDKKIFLDWHTFYKNGKLYKGNTKEPYIKDRPMVITHTSGTTSTPKGAVFSSDGFNAMVHQIKHSTNLLERGDKELLLVHPFPVYSLCNQVYMPLLLGITVVMVPDLEVKKINYYIEKYQINHLQGLPSQYKEMVKEDNVNYSSIKYIVSGGSNLDDNLHSKLQEKLKKGGSSAIPTNGYGMTELGSCAACSFGMNFTGSGIPLFKNNIKIVDLDNSNKTLGKNEFGEVYMTGPSMMLGYYNRPKETDEVIKIENGIKWIKTGDIGKVNKDGDIFIQGRIKRMSLVMDPETGISSKANHGDIEKIIKQHEMVSDCAVVAVPDENTYNAIKAYIVLRENQNYQSVLYDINENCHKQLRKNFSPIEYSIIDQIPINKNGKIDYLLLEKDAIKNNIEQISNVKKLVKKRF